MSLPSRINRTNLLSPLRDSSTWDLIIIGGGASGLGTAIEAATRGYKTLLLEAYDFAKGTSSRSTKLIHGGVRYLAQGNIRLVREALRERGFLYKNAPHLVQPMKFIVPAYSWLEVPFYGIGLKLYDLLSGRRSLGHSIILDKKDALSHAPTLKDTGLCSGILYYDGQFDDARLAITLLRTLLDHGGTAINYMPVIGFLKYAGKISGVIAQDTETNEQYELHAQAVVNATGVWIDTVRHMDEPDALSILSPSQGVHLVVERKFMPGDSAIMIPRTIDKRILFAVPWHNRVVIGTTDTPVPEVNIEPRSLPEEIDFILRTAKHYIDPAPDLNDICSIYAGLRPLVTPDRTKLAKATAALSRDHVLRESASGLVTVTGGKWTTYRQMGEDTVNYVAKRAGLRRQTSLTRNLSLHGWTQTPEAAPLDVYGTDAALVRSLPGADKTLHHRLPYVEAEVRHSARFELARTVEDVLARRTRALLLDAAASIEMAPRVANILAEELGFDDEWKSTQMRMYTALARRYISIF